MTVFDSQSLPSLLSLPDEAFGPDSDHPCLTVELDGLDEASARRLARLPCPVIGVGEGPAGGWLDLTVTTPAAASG